MGRLLPLSLAFAAYIAFPAAACVSPPPPSFDEELAGAETVAIVRVEAESMRPPRDPWFVPQIEASARVVEVLKGADPKLRTIEYVRSWCGGHDLDVGGYYVVLLRAGDAVLTLEQESVKVLGLGDEYVEHVPDEPSGSLLLFHLRNFARIERFPATFDVAPYRALVTPDRALPSRDVRQVWP